LVDALCEWNASGIVKVYLDGIQKTTEQIGSWKYGTSSDGPGGSLSVYFNGALLNLNCQSLNFVNGPDRTDDDPGVLAETDSGIPTQTNLYIHPPKWASHFNTEDGVTDARLLLDIESQCLQMRRVPRPTADPGGNFEITGLSPGATIQGSHYTPVLSFAPLETFSVLDLESEFIVRILRADGTTLITSHSTGAIPLVGYESLTNGIRIVVGHLVPDGTKYRTTLLVQVYIQPILASVALNGGRYYLSIQQVNGAETPLPYSRYLFYDPNFPGDSRDPEIGPVYITEGAPVVLKYLSGIRYYGLNSRFNLDLEDILRLNEKTFPQYVLEVDPTSMGIGDSILGFTGSQLTNWTVDWNTEAACNLENIPIDQEDFRHIGEFVALRARFPNTAIGWVNPTAWDNLITSKFCIDTYLSESTDLFEPFVDENYRRTQFDLAGSYNPGEVWDPLQDLNTYDDALGAMIQNGELTNRRGDWTDYLPSGSPDYTSIPLTCTYYRRFISDGKAYTSVRIFLTAGSIGTTAQLIQALKTGIGARMYLFVPYGDWRIRGKLHAPFNFVNFNSAIMNGGVYDDTLSEGCFDTSDEVSITASFGHREMNDTANIMEIQLELDGALLSVSTIAVQFQGA
jgi:hypothetical protein